MLSTYLSTEAAERLRRGGTWARREDIIRIDGEPKLGEPVSLRDEQGASLGIADLDLEAPVAVRRLGMPEDSAESLIPTRLRAAFEHRAHWVDDPRFCRLVNDEGDGLPGLIIDRYDQHFVVQTFSRAMDARVQEIARGLTEVVGAESVVLRNDTVRRARVGLEKQRAHVLLGTPPRWRRILELGARLTVDLMYGHGTGYFFDQREVRRLLARLSLNARVLDVRCHVGGLFVHAGLHGAREIRAYEPDHDAAELARENAEANGLLGRAHVQTGDGFAALARKVDPYDLVLVDLPDTDTTEEHARTRLRRCIRATRHGGRLVAIGYSPPLPPEGLERVLTEACQAEGRIALRLARLGPPADFPVVLGSGAEALSALAVELG